jgi:hypothetical protein
MLIVATCFAAVVAIALYGAFSGAIEQIPGET